MTLARSLSGGAIVLAIALFARAEEKYSLRFQYRDGEKSVYDMTVKLDVTTSAAQLSQRQESSSSTQLRLSMDVVDRVQEGKKPSLGVTFRDLSVEQKLAGPAGDVSVTISGRDVVVKRGEGTIVDTKKGEGLQLASGLLREFGFLDTEGTVVLEPEGRIGAVTGSKEFEQFLAAETGSSLFVLETPPGPVGVGETWAAPERSVSRLRGLDLSANPVPVKTRFTLEGLEERPGGRLARIAVRSETAQKDLSATASSDALGSQPVTITSFERTATGVVLFDIARGELVESELDVKLSVKMEMSFDSPQSPGGKEKVETSLAGTARVTTKLRG